jgi:uncharacterized membrane protein
MRNIPRQKTEVTEADENYGLLSNTSGIEETRNPARQRHLHLTETLRWLRVGWRDLAHKPGLSLAYGLAGFALSLVVIWGMFALGWDQVLFPALAGFMVVGPVVAIGLYEKSRAIETGEPVTVKRMVLVRTKSGGQIFFVGVLLCLLMLMWMRTAVLIYALFFGLLPFPGLDHITDMLFTTLTGWALLVTGILVGGLFAAFSFAISVFSIPMLLDERTDALTAMGTSVALVWNNLPVMTAWGAVVVTLFCISVATALLGLIIVFPLLGHASWHAYRAVHGEPRGDSPPATSLEAHA